MSKNKGKEIKTKDSGKSDFGEKVTFKISKNDNFSEWYSEIVARAELADLRYNIKGFVVMMPWAVQVIEKMYSLWEKELQKQGHLPCFFPALIPEGNFMKEAEHVKGFSPDVFWITNVGDAEINEKLALRPTSETAFYQLYSLWIRSYKDLPFMRYQRANVWRYETKATRPFIRSREFHWIETHNCFLTKEDAEKRVLQDIEITEKIMHKTLGIPFYGFRRPEWDKFAGAVYTIGSDSLMPDGKIIQQPSTHLLGQNFAKAFNVKFRDKDGQEKYPFTTTYGPAISRIYASLISIHGDDSGLVLPYCVSPIQVVIIPIIKPENKSKVLEYCEKIKKELEKSEITCKIDESEKKPGEKFYYWEMKGVPLRLDIGEKEAKSGELICYLRDKKEKKNIKDKNIAESIKEEGEKLDIRIMEKADKAFQSSIVDADSIEKIKKAVENKKIARINFCSVAKDGEKCAGVIERETGATVRGVRHNIKEQAKGKCVVCSGKANEVVYVAKSY
jgi:prolyl-tRNA synthetase